MPNSLTAASCLSRQSPRYVWISDVLLTDTFNRFCHHKRYGSSVPGPLEAQRRATKRKNTSLAHVSSGGISTDPAIVLGSSANKLAWWNSPRDTGAKTTPAQYLPPWFFPPHTSTVETETTASGPQTPVDDWAVGLSRCRTVADIKDWVREEEINIRQDASIGAAVLNHVLASEDPASTMEEIATYVCDPTFHSPGSSFILDLVHKVLPRAWDVTSWDILRQSICSATELGLISIDDIKSIITAILGASSLRVTVEARFRKNARSIAQLHMVCGIVEYLDRCAVLQVTDLGTKLLRKLFSVYATKCHLRWCKAMVWRLLPWAPKSRVPFVARLTLYPLEVQRPQDSVDEILGKALADRLIRADPEVLQLVLAYTTEKLLAYSRATRMMDCRFMWHHWYCTLAMLGSPSYNVSLTKSTWDLLQYAKSCISPDQRLFVFAWNVMCLSHDSRMSANLSDRLHFLDRFEGLVASLPSLTMDASRLTLVGLDELNLPHKDVLVRHMTRLTVCEDKSPALPEIDPAIKRTVSPSRLDKRIQHAHFGHSEPLAEVLQTYGFPAFKAFSRRMIHKNPMSFGIVCYLLETDPKLNMAMDLRRVAWGSKHSPQKPMPLGPSSKQRTNISGLPTREEIIDLILDLAISFATSPVATPRSAFRRVYWCYLFLCCHRIPIPPIISRSLWHAGVTRYSDQGTAAVLLKWVVRRVSEVEGEDTARHLLWNERFRLSRAEQMNAWAELTPEEEQVVLAMLRGDDSTPDERERETDQAPSSPTSVTFSTEQVNALLTGDEDLDRGTRNKISFLQSESPYRPFWCPVERDGAQHGDQSIGAGNIFLTNRVIPLSFLGNYTDGPDEQWWYGDQCQEHLGGDGLPSRSFVWESQDTLPSYKSKYQREKGAVLNKRPHEWSK